MWSGLQTCKRAGLSSKLEILNSHATARSRIETGRQVTAWHWFHLQKVASHRPTLTTREIISHCWRQLNCV